MTALDDLKNSEDDNQIQSAANQPQRNLKSAYGGLSNIKINLKSEY